MIPVNVDHVQIIKNGVNLFWSRGVMWFDPYMCCFIPPSILQSNYFDFPLSAHWTTNVSLYYWEKNNNNKKTLFNSPHPRCMFQSGREVFIVQLSLFKIAHIITNFHVIDSGPWRSASWARVCVTSVKGQKSIKKNLQHLYDLEYSQATESKQSCLLLSGPLFLKCIISVLLLLIYHWYSFMAPQTEQI